MSQPIGEAALSASANLNDNAERPMMRAARLHNPGEKLRIETVERPQVGPTEVLVKVMACGVAPNMINVLHHMANWPDMRQPALPAIYGLDVSGVIEAVGSQVHSLSVGDRVYVNPARYCGSCRPCRSGNTTACNYYMFNGYFGSGEESQKLYDYYVYGGFAEFMSAPQYSIVKIPDNLSFEMAARWGYLGTAYAALRRGGVNMSSRVLINGITGTLGLGAAVFALALGARKVLGLGRNQELLERVKKLCPERIHVASLSGGDAVRKWARSLTDGDGADVVIDALPTGGDPAAFLAALAGLARGGRHVNVGGVTEDVGINFLQLMNDHKTLVGSLWFTTDQGQEMADLAETGTVKLDMFEHEIFALDRLNEVLDSIGSRHGGFSNYVIAPDPEALTGEVH